MKSYLSLSFPLFSIMERLLKSFHALPEDYVSHLYAPKMNHTQPLHLFSFLSFIHSVCGPDIRYIPFLCYSNTSKSMVHFYSDTFLFSITRKISYCSCLSPKYLRITSVSSKWTKYVTIFFPLMYCLNFECQLVQSILKYTTVKHCWFGFFFLFKFLYI